MFDTELTEVQKSINVETVLAIALAVAKEDPDEIGKAMAAYFGSETRDKHFDMSEVDVEKLWQLYGCLQSLVLTLIPTEVLEQLHGANRKVLAIEQAREVVDGN